MKPIPIHATFADGPDAGQQYVGILPWGNEVRSPSGALYSYCEGAFFYIPEAAAAPVAANYKNLSRWARLPLLPERWAHWWRYAAGADLSRGCNKNRLGFVWANTKLFMS